MSYGQIAPHPGALVESLRALGYSLEAAIADLVDNSIAAEATAVEITFDWNNGDPFASVLDNGRGMTTGELIEAMRLGGAGPSASRRVEDLGRYGLGLKTASFSQCQRLTVASKRERDVAYARWDLDVLAGSDVGWELLSEPAPGSESRLSPLDRTNGTGTMVLWEVLRTGAEGSLSRFLEALENLERHLAMVFQRVLDGERGRFAISLNGRRIKAWDPFVTWHPATIMKPVARFRDPSGDIEVRGYVLPHKDRFRNAAEHEAAGGPEGWVAQQGFYVYRAGRLIVAGGWLGLGGSREWLRDEASQLARLRIDIPTTSDAMWRIDVRKATARPPGSLREHLVRLALDVRRSARDVYAHRGARGFSEGGTASGGAWRASASRRYPYAIKREHPAVQAVLDIAIDPALVDSMLVAIERSVPVPVAVANEDPSDTDANELVLAGRVLMRNLIALGLRPEEAVERVACTEPFSHVRQIASRLRDGT